MKYPVLVLNSDYLPYGVVDWKKAFVKVYCKDDASGYIVSTYKKTVVDSVGRKYNIPAVIVLNNYMPANNKIASYSKVNVKLRDQNQCQYCGYVFDPKLINIDHVIPKSKRQLLSSEIKLSSFQNCVAACFYCNEKKADRTPKEAKMQLIKVPKPITRSQKVCLSIKSKKYPEEWKEYIDTLPY